MNESKTIQFLNEKLHTIRNLFDRIFQQMFQQQQKQQQQVLNTHSPKMKICNGKFAINKIIRIICTKSFEMTTFQSRFNSVCFITCCNILYCSCTHNRLTNQQHFSTAATFLPITFYRIAPILNTNDFTDNCKCIRHEHIQMSYLVNSMN